jgi:hypothetical protein
MSRVREISIAKFLQRNANIAEEVKVKIKDKFVRIGTMCRMCTIIGNSRIFFDRKIRKDRFDFKKS